jgi:hypothetical protein
MLTTASDQSTAIKAIACRRIFDNIDFERNPAIRARKPTAS